MFKKKLRDSFIVPFKNGRGKMVSGFFNKVQDPNHVIGIMGFNQPYSIPINLETLL